MVWAENGAITTEADSVLNAWRSMFGTFAEADCSWGETYVQVLGPDAAVFSATFVNHVTDGEGAQTDFEGVWTGVFERTAEGFQVVYGHESYSASPVM